MKLIAFAALTLILLPPAFAQERGDAAVSKVVALEKAWNQAYKLRDRRALLEILHDSMIVVDADGSFQSRSMFLAGIEAAPASDGQQSEPESISVQLFGDVAIATGVFRETGFKNGKAYLKRNRFIDTWVSKGDSWICVAATATPIH
jgi:ketosteroid isomerase-like protein